MMGYFGVPLGPDVFVTRRADEREAYQEDVGLRIRKGTKTVIVLLPCGIPQTKRNRFPVNHDIGRVVVENSGNVFSRERISGVRNKETSLPDGTISYDNTFDGLHADEIL